MVVGDPALVVALAVAAAGRAGRLGPRQRLRLDDGHLLGLFGAARAAAGSAAGLLREERLDPRLVDEVERRAEDAGQEEVEEDAVRGGG